MNPDQAMDWIIIFAHIMFVIVFVVLMYVLAQYIDQMRQRAFRSPYSSSDLGSTRILEEQPQPLLLESGLEERNEFDEDGNPFVNWKELIDAFNAIDQEMGPAAEIQILNSRPAEDHEGVVVRDEPESPDEELESSTYFQSRSPEQQARIRAIAEENRRSRANFEKKYGHLKFTGDGHYGIYSD
jgi:hypothetical protein